MKCPKHDSISVILILSAVYISILSTSQVYGQEEEGLDSFKIDGQIDSVLYTVGGKWLASGLYDLVVEDGEVSSFNVTMGWRNESSSHTHGIQNFVADDDGIVLGPDRTLSIEGKMDVVTNGQITWEKVPGEISIEEGKIITIAVDPEAVDNHFGSGSIVHGTVDKIQACSSTPGANMNLPIACS